MRMHSLTSARTLEETWLQHAKGSTPLHLLLAPGPYGRGVGVGCHEGAENRANIERSGEYLWVRSGAEEPTRPRTERPVAIGAQRRPHQLVKGVPDSLCGSMQGTALLVC